MTYRVILEVKFKNNIRESCCNIAVNLKKSLRSISWYYHNFMIVDNFLYEQLQIKIIYKLGIYGLSVFPRVFSVSFFAFFFFFFCKYSLQFSRIGQRGWSLWRQDELQTSRTVPLLRAWTGRSRVAVWISSNWPNFRADFRKTIDSFMARECRKTFQGDPFQPFALRFEISHFLRSRELFERKARKIFQIFNNDQNN